MSSSDLPQGNTNENNPETDNNSTSESLNDDLQHDDSAVKSDGNDPTSNSPDPVEIPQPEEAEEYPGLTQIVTADSEENVSSDPSGEDSITVDSAQDTEPSDGSTQPGTPDDEAFPDADIPEVPDDDDEHALEDLSAHTTEELVDLIEKYADSDELLKVRPEFNQLRVHLKNQFDHDFEEVLTEYLDGGGTRDDFTPPANPLRDRFNLATKKFFKRKDELQKNKEKEMQQNLAHKKDILDELRIIAEQEENIGRAFEKFRELQERWRSVGPVPFGEVRDLQLNYHFLNNLFYKHIEINRELQDLDQKKNLEVKTRLCEEAEALINEPSFNTAFAKLDVLQQSWREIGMVPMDVKDSIWERFISARKALVDKRNEYKDLREAKREENLALKTELCTEAESIVPGDEWKHKEWQDAVRKLLEIQARWRKIGPVPGKVNDEIWNRFRTASDKIFTAKNQFYNSRKKEYAENLKKKTALCEEAEKLQHSTEWKFTTSELIRLQKQWKEIGPVGERRSDKIWKRFRKACDTFFNNKKDHFADMDKANEENLKEKESLLEEITSFTHPEDTKKVIEALRDFQQRWSAIGFVPINKKEEIQAKYRKAIDSHYDKLKLDKSEKQKLRYQQKLESIRNSDDPRKLDGERRYLQNKINELKNDLSTLENNIGFFGHSKGSEKMKAEFEKKIRKAKDEINSLYQKLDLLKSSDN